MNHIQYRIMTWEERGEWRFCIKKYVRVIFKRSKREGWHWQGFIAHGDNQPRFETRAEALAFAKAVKDRILGLEKRQL